MFVVLKIGLIICAPSFPLQDIFNAYLMDPENMRLVRNRMPVSLRGGGGELGNLKP
jgi:hypothetical protein